MLLCITVVKPKPGVLAVSSMEATPSSRWWRSMSSMWPKWRRRLPSCAGAWWSSSVWCRKWWGLPVVFLHRMYHQPQPLGSLTRLRGFKLYYLGHPMSFPIAPPCGYISVSFPHMKDSSLIWQFFVTFVPVWVAPLHPMVGLMTGGGALIDMGGKKSAAL